MTYQECVDYILSIPLFGKKLGTENLNMILDEMGHPEQSCPVIHIAGTNGKGSTCLFLASILEKSGYRVGVFTSPHLLTINERIRINNCLISDEDFLCAFEEVMLCISRMQKRGIEHPSFFEFVFLMACVYFKKCRTNYVIFETGMGGRLDATNVVKPVLSVITSIGLDHTQFLGDTIEQIAWEKAGIIKQGTAAVYFDRKDSATAVIADYAEKIGAKLYVVEKKQYKNIKIMKKTIAFSFDSGYYMYSSLEIKKTALYQIENAVLAVKAYELLMNRKDRLTDRDIQHVKAGLLDMTWPCRMQEISHNVYIDGAHNEEAVEAFCDTVEALFHKERKILLFAVSKDKDYKAMIKRLCTVSFEEIVIVRYAGDRAADVTVVEDTFRHFSGSKITTFEDIYTGFAYAKSHIEEQLLFCVGSLYLAGDLLTFGV